MAKHTKGPWFLFGNPAHCVGGPHVENGTGGIAMCGMRLREPEEAAANARLISAAPDLLAVCEALVSLLTHGGSAVERAEVVEAADKAIAKAKGE